MPGDDGGRSVSELEQNKNLEYACQTLSRDPSGEGPMQGEVSRKPRWNWIPILPGRACNNGAATVSRLLHHSRILDISA